MVTRDWTEELWQAILDAAVLPIEFEPHWYNLPAIGRLTITRPELLRPFEEHNRRHPLRVVRPHTFVSVAYPKLFAGPNEVRLFAPYVSDPRDALDLTWYELRSGDQVHVTTDDLMGAITPGRIAVKSYGDVARDYAAHPEAKFIGPDGTCLRSTYGTLGRRNVHATRAEYIGKEGNLLGRRIEGYGAPGEVQQLFEDPHDFQRYVIPRLTPQPIRQVASRVGLSERALRDILAGRVTPRSTTQKALTELAYADSQKTRTKRS